MTLQHLSAVKKLLILNFVFLLLFQIFVGFQDLDDYLVIFVFALFLNDLYFKLYKPTNSMFHENKRRRIWMSLLLLLIVLMPNILETLQVKSSTQSFLGKVSLILWAQAFLLDSFLHYRETHSRRWLLFTNIGGIFILFFSIAF